MEPPYLCECMSLWIFSWAWHVIYIYHCMCKYYEHVFVVGNYIPCATSPCLSLSWFVHVAGMCTGPGAMRVNSDACVHCWLAPMTWQCVRCWWAVRHSGFALLLSYQGSSRPILNLGHATSLGTEWPFHRSHLKPLENTDISITIHNSSKLQVWSSQGNNFIVGGHNTRNCIKGLQP